MSIARFVGGNIRCRIAGPVVLMGVAPLGPRAILFTAWTCFDEYSRWYQHLSPHSACFLGGLTGGSWPPMVPPKKEIPSIASPPVLPSGNR